MNLLEKHKETGRGISLAMAFGLCAYVQFNLLVLIFASVPVQHVVII